MEALSQVIGKPAVEGGRKAKWTDLVLARERVAGAPSPSEGSSSPAKPSLLPGATGAQDFAGVATRPGAQRRQSDRRPVAKSAPTSPMKGPPMSRPPPPPNGAVARPRTPPMAPRSAHRSRDAVKSMIF